MKRDFDALEKRRLEAARLLDQGLNCSQVARQLKVVPQTVSRWSRERQALGMAALRKAGRAGRKPRLTEAERERLEQLLVQGPEKLGYETLLWTCPRVAHLIAEEFGVSYHEGHVWKVLANLGWSPQRPVGKARERDEEQIRTWKKTTWPAIRKKRSGKGGRSSSSTRAD